jgi:hypothetical protein
MGMIRSNITVVEDGLAAAALTEPEIKPVPAGVTIPTGEVAVGVINYDDRQSYQTVSINLRDDGFSPSLIVVQRGLPTLWTINNDSLEAGNSELIFPVYYTSLPMRDGDNTLQLLPTEDFEFSTADNVYYGLVKVVDDINNVNVAAVKTQAAAWETLIYPPEYFDQASGGGGGGCCQ